MSARTNGSGLSEEEYREMMEEQEREREQRQTASQMASQAAMDPGAGAGNEPGYWDVIGDPDIGRTEDPQHLEDYLSTQFSNSLAIGNIRRSDWESMQWQIENEFWTMRNEFKSADSALDGDDMRIMYGEEKPELTDEMERRSRSAMQVKKAFTSLMVDGEGLRRGTEIHAVAKTENQGEEADDGGRVSSIRNWLSG